MADELTPQMRRRYQRALRADTEHLTTLSVLWMTLQTRARGAALPDELAVITYEGGLVAGMTPADAARAAAHVEKTLEDVTATLPVVRWSDRDGAGWELANDPAAGLAHDKERVREATQVRLRGDALYGDTRRYRAPRTPG